MSAAREQIIQTTCELLELQGYHATGLNQIIRESGSPKGSLYYYFPGGKEELTAEAILHVGQIVTERIRANLAIVDSPADAISAFIRNVAQNVVLSGYRTGGPITTVAMETASTSERLREDCRLIYAGWQTIFAEKLISGGMGGDQARAIAAVIICALEGGIILARTERSPLPLEHIADMLGNLIRISSTA